MLHHRLPFVAFAFLGLGCARARPPMPAPTPAPLSNQDAAQSAACERPQGMFGPVRLDARAADVRTGLGHTQLSSIQTSKARPVEVCGVKNQLRWLLAATCDDGSSPFSDGRTAHAARAGSLGAGGRCGSIIDLYNVPCPEGAYAVHMDAYACGPGESMDD